MLDKEWYREWIGKRNSFKINEKVNPGIDDLLWKDIIKYGLPQKVGSFLFLGVDNYFLKPLMELVKNQNYKKEKLKDYHEILENSLFIGRFLGDYICINSNNDNVEIIDAETFDKEFMNETIEEFFEFFEIYSKMMMTVESNNGLDCNSDELTDEQIDRFELDLKSIATKSWDNYSRWIRDIESMRYLKMLFS